MNAISTDTFEKSISQSWREAQNLLARKRADYNRVVDFPAYLAFGDKSAFQQIWEKVLRLYNLLADDKRATNESFDDSIDDLICFGILWRSYRRAQRVEEVSDARRSEK